MHSYRSTENMPVLLLFDATPESLLRDAKDLIQITQDIWDNVIAANTVESATFETLFVPIIQDENKKSEKIRLLKFYAFTHPSKDLRDASTAASGLFADAEVELQLLNSMYALANAAASKINDDPNFDAESRHYVATFRRRLLQSGAALQQEGRTRLAWR